MGNPAEETYCYPNKLNLMTTPLFVNWYSAPLPEVSNERSGLKNHWVRDAIGSEPTLRTMRRPVVRILEAEVGASKPHGRWNNRGDPFSQWLQLTVGRNYNSCRACKPFGFHEPFRYFQSRPNARIGGGRRGHYSGSVLCDQRFFPRTRAWFADHVGQKPLVESDGMVCLGIVRPHYLPGLPEVRFHGSALDDRWGASGFRRRGFFIALLRADNRRSD